MGDCRGRTPLHKAVMGQQVTSLTALLEWGAEPEILDWECQSPLAFARAIAPESPNREDLIRLLEEAVGLLEEGCSPCNGQDGRSKLQSARKNQRTLRMVLPSDVCHWTGQSRRQAAIPSAARHTLPLLDKKM